MVGIAPAHGHLGPHALAAWANSAEDRSARLARLAIDGGVVQVVDGGNCMGQVSTTFAMRAGIERVRTTGVAVAAIGGSNHRTAMSSYTRLAAAEG